MDWFWFSRCPNNHIDLPNMTEYLKVVPLPSWWPKLELKYLSISELFEELLGWNWNLSWLPPNILLAPIFVPMWLSLFFLIKSSPLKLPLPLVSNTFNFSTKHKKSSFRAYSLPSDWDYFSCHLVIKCGLVWNYKHRIVLFCTYISVSLFRFEHVWYLYQYQSIYTYL